MWVKLFLLAAALLLFSACTPNAGLRALIDATQGWLSPLATTADQQPALQLDPSVHYLRVVRDGREAFLALGFVDTHPAGAVEVWYSGAAEVLRIQNGRLVGSTGGQYQWLQTSFSRLPDWSAALGRSHEFERERDLHPGYRWALRERLLLQPIAPPARHHMLGIAAAELHWFEERTLGGHAQALPPSRYAVHVSAAGAQVLYAQTCLGPDLCISWQRWSGRNTPLLP